MNIDAVLTSLNAYARQIGINTFWLEWDEAAHFDLDDRDEVIFERSLSAWAKHEARALAFAYFALPLVLQQERAIRLAAASLNEVAMQAFFATLNAARVDRTNLPRKVHPDALHIFDGTGEITIARPKRLKPFIDQSMPAPLVEPPAKNVLWGYRLDTPQNDIVVEDKLYEELLAELGAPSDIEPVTACAAVTAHFANAGVRAQIYPIGWSVQQLSIAGTATSTTSG